MNLFPLVQNSSEKNDTYMFSSEDSYSRLLVLSRWIGRHLWVQFDTAALIYNITFSIATSWMLISIFKTRRILFTYNETIWNDSMTEISSASSRLISCVWIIFMELVLYDMSSAYIPLKFAASLLVQLSIWNKIYFQKMLDMETLYCISSAR